MDRGEHIVGVYRNVRNMTFLGKKYPTVLVCNGGNHAYDVRLKEPYDENLKRLNEYVAKTYPTKALEFIPVGAKLESMYKDVSRFRFTSAFILIIVLIGYVNDETQRATRR